MNRENLFSVDCLVNKGSSKETAYLILHGYGADFTDLAPLSDVLGGNPNGTWIFPNGFLTTQFGGRAWFPIDVAELERAMATGVHRDLSQKRPQGMDQARQRLMPLYEDLLKSHQKVVVGGFSQGAMMAMELALYGSKAPSGLVLFSGTLVDQGQWEQRLDKLDGVKIFQSHGTDDPLLAYEHAENLRNLMLSKDLDVQFVDFRGGHEIPQKVISQAQSFLNQIN